LKTSSKGGKRTEQKKSDHGAGELAKQRGKHQALYWVAGWLLREHFMEAL